jgi:hypothetical protein
MTGGDGEIGGFLLEKGIADHFFTKPCSINHICKTLITENINWMDLPHKEELV